MKISTVIILGLGLCGGVAYADDYFDPAPRSDVRYGVTNPTATSPRSLAQVTFQLSTEQDHKADFVKRYNVDTTS